jgi:sarcosine oxidase subunit alpha
MRATEHPGAYLYDLAVIGGGPAGLLAARDVARGGGRVVVLDENHAMGGKLRGQLHEKPGDAGWWLGPQLAEQAARDAQEAGVRLVTDVTVWGLEPGWSVRMSRSCDGVSSELRARTVLVATGAVERPMPLPGWTTPGVMTVGAAQVLTNVHRVRPGRRAVVVGFDVLSLTIARAMQLAGVEVVGVVLPPQSVEGSSPRETLSRLAPMAKLAPAAYMRVGGRVLSLGAGRRAAARLVPRTLKMWGIPLHLRTAVSEVEGTDQVTGVTVTDVRADGTPVVGSERNLAVDAVCLANGLAPLNELVATLGCEFYRSSDLGGGVPLHSAELRTSIEGLYVAGNAIGIESAEIAMLQGELVAASIIEDLRLCSTPPGGASRAAAELTKARRTMEFQFSSQVQRGHDRVQNAWEQRVEAS